jgi:hypothetical protein
MIAAARRIAGQVLVVVTAAASVPGLGLALLGHQAVPAPVRIIGRQPQMIGRQQDQEAEVPVVLPVGSGAHIAVTINRPRTREPRRCATTTVAATGGRPLGLVRLKEAPPPGRMIGATIPRHRPVPATGAAEIGAPARAVLVQAALAA